MRLAERMAMHAGSWQPAAVESRRVDRVDVDVEVAGAAVSQVEVAVRLDAVSSRAVEVERAAPVVKAGISVGAPRGSAWANGAYRLFVRGRPVRGRAPVVVEVSARELEAMAARSVPWVEVGSRPLEAVAARRASEVAKAAQSVEAGSRAVEAERAREVATVLANFGGCVEARVGSETAGCEPVEVVESLPGREPLSVHGSRLGVAEPVGSLQVRADPDVATLGAATDGIVRRVVEWPLVGGLRSAVLGGALARLELPTAAAWRRLAPQLAGVPMPGEGGSPVVFLDVETTALDRGAGALAFMVGVAAFVGKTLRVEQWILSQLSAEPAMLTEVVERVAALAGQGAVLASYNGASFDVPLLRTRLQRARTLTRVAPLRSGLERPHVDLLHPARRMWQGRDRDCRLGTLERTRLGVRRVHDIAGHEIPAVFWAWLRRPDDVEVRALMQRAADHNLADLVVLPALGAAIGRCLAAPEDLEAAVRSAQHLVTCGRRDQALALLAVWHARPGPAPLRRRALLLAADLLRRDGSGCAPELWAEVCRISPGDPTAHEALAKHLEHRVGDLERALAVASTSATPCPKRVARLQRKLGAAPPNN